MILKSLYSAFKDAFFPPRCVFCGEVLPLEKGVCTKCSGKVRRIEPPICTHCGLNTEKCTCGKKEHYFESICAPFEYTGVVRNGIHLYKFRGAESSAESFSAMIADCVRKNYGNVSFDLALGVPTTPGSVKERGFDQVELLAKGAAERLGIGYRGKLLTKLYETNRQHLLHALFRSGNLTGVFDVARPDEVSGKTVLLIDDVSTSGETLDECSKMLYLAGADKIYCAVLALAVKND